MFKKLLKLFAGLVALIAILVVSLVAKAMMTPSRQVPSEPFEALSVNADTAVAHLSEAIRIHSVSSAVPALFDREKTREFHVFLEKAYPAAHAALKREVVGDFSLMYTWTGRDPARKPILLLAHMDVVPVDEFRAQSWAQDPFGGAVADGFVWGRGTLDDKGSLVAIMEAVEALVASGFQPERTIYLCFGHDEELGGPVGATSMAALLAERRIKAEFTLDEGMGMMDGIVPGMKQPLAIVALAEKGFLTLTLSVEHKGGHSSNPPEHSAVGILAAAVTRLENQQMPASLEGPFRGMFEAAGPEMEFPLRVVTANLWLLEPLVVKMLLADPSTASALRSTTAVTMFESGVAPNVLPTHAQATVNFRIMPRDTVEGVIEHARKVINDERVKIEVAVATPPSPVSDPASPSFALLARTIRQVFPDVAVAPGMDLGGSDAKHYVHVSEQVYHFWPFYMADADTKRLHGTDERLAVVNYLKAIQFYVQIIRNAN